MPWFLNIHVIATGFMTGLIWFMQLVHYPSFRWADRATFPALMKHHQHWTSVIVGPAMLCEALTGAGLCFVSQPSVNPFILWSNMAAIVAIWGCTYFLSVPAHERLLAGYDEATIARLISTNWPRTILWSGRSLAILVLLK